MEEGFKLKSHNKNSTFVAALVLSPSKDDETIEKCGNKRGLIYLCCT